MLDDDCPTGNPLTFCLPPRLPGPQGYDLDCYGTEAGRAREQGWWLLHKLLWRVSDNKIHFLLTGLFLLEDAILMTQGF